MHASVMSMTVAALAMSATVTLTAAAANVDDRPVIVYESVSGLRDALLAWTAARLLPSRLFVDEKSARLTLTRTPAAGAIFVAVPLWAAADVAAGLPMEFVLQPAQDGRGPAPQAEIRLTLSGSVLREAWVAARRLPKGTPISCADGVLERRGLRFVPRDALVLPCDLPSGAVALRHLGARDVLRSVDVGPAPEVLAGLPVQVTAVAGAVVIVTEATALSDASLGDTVAVRLDHPVRTLKARATGPQAVILLEATR